MPLDFGLLKQYNELFEQIDTKNDWIRFYNHGYGGKPLLDYDKKDLKFKNRGNLYAHLFEGIDVKNKNLIDIGCGLGRGCNLLKKHFPLKSITGIDININHVMFAKKNFKGIKFLQCDAEELNTLTDKYDIAINVESLCYYYDKENFYRGLYSILNKGGTALITTPIVTNKLEFVDQMFTNNGFKIVEKKDITGRVRDGLIEDSINFKNVFQKVNEDWINDVRQRLVSIERAYAEKQAAYITYKLERL